MGSTLDEARSTRAGAKEASPASRASLQDSRVLIVGLGGLGCPASLALALAGVRRFTFVDPDRVEPSNLPRQLWHRLEDVGRLKVESARERMRAAFPQVEIDARPERLSAANARALLEAHSLVIDAVDGVATKLLLSDAAVLTGRPLVYGGALRWSGQAMAIVRGGPCLRCLYETAPADGPTCASAGVINSVVGQVGALQALLAEEALRGVGGRLLLVEGKTLSSRAVTVHPNPDCVACGAGARPALADPEAVRCA
jgi:molybdopterin/thiamine biosynthesis adenylyltransferase